jgi:hypothetical protein
VFSYRAASTNNAPELTYCCLPEGDGTTFYRNKADTYGEFAVNPDTGVIMRIVINADLDEERDPDATESWIAIPMIPCQCFSQIESRDVSKNEQTQDTQKIPRLRLG